MVELTEQKLAQIVLGTLNEVTGSQKAWGSSLLLNWGELDLVAIGIEREIQIINGSKEKCYDVSLWKSVSRVYSDYAKMYGLNQNFDYDAL